MSLRAKLAVWNLKRNVKPQPMHLLDPQVLRDQMEAFAPKKVPPGISIEEVVEGGVRGEWHRPARPANGRTIFYLHGGGYIFGSAKSHRALTFALAEQAEANVFSLDYRLAPEHPAPAAADDAVAAYQWLLAQGVDPAKLTIAGDSAGGGLTLALAYGIKTRGLPMPAGLVVFSPWTDLAVTGASIDENGESDALFKPEYIRDGVHRILQGADPKAPLISPLYADVAGFPPTLIFASEAEVLRDDGLRMAERLKGANVETTLITEKKMPHVWPLFIGAFPEAKKGVAQAAAFIREKA